MRAAEDVPTLVLRAESSHLSASAVEALSAELPRDEGELAGLLDAAIAGYLGRAFTVTALAGLHAGIPVAASHLVFGARLLPDPRYLAKLSTRVAGDVVGALLGAVEDGRLSREKEAVTLFLAAHLSRERGDDDAHRRRLVRRTRMCARVAEDLAPRAFTVAAAGILEDDELSELLDARHGDELPESFVRLCHERLLETARQPLLDGLRDDEEEHPLTRRRAVRRVGRNEPCPCGSGRKYKRCCAERDRERLRDSSDVAGLTRAEMRLRPEEHLTAERIFSMHAYELARLDPRRVDPGLHGMILTRLTVFEELEAARDFLDAAGGGGHVVGHVWDAVDTALRTGRRELARTFLQLTPPSEDERIGFPIRLLTAGLESAPALDLLESEARERVDEAAVDLACDLLNGPWPHLGLLVARGAAALAAPWDRETLLQEIGLARDRLDLPALDPTEGLEDLWGAPEEGERAGLVDEPRQVPESAAPAPSRDDEARRRLGEKEAELARIRAELSELRQKLEAPPEPVAAGSDESLPPPEDPRVAKLKERMSHLRTELTQRHAERNQLRRLLERAQKRVDALEAERQVAPPPTRDDAPDEEEGAEEVLPALAYRVPVFGRRFRSSAQGVPDPVRRAAVVLASRIASGDPAAFRGSRRLERDRDLCRQRVGRDYRLFFRLEDDEVEVLDLVRRKDLERVVRELTRG